MDILYGRIKFSPLCMKFINTKEFERLRRVKQNALLHIQYPSSNHTRYEHCLGVAYLAGKMYDKLSNDKSVPHFRDLVQISALYHDIGHFAFSHLFDRILQNNNISSKEHSVHEIFDLHEHEDRSIYLLNKVNNELQLLSSTDIEFISNCIKGVIPENVSDPFMYQIVCNKICGVDVDKLDYLVRDSLYLCVKNRFLDVDKIISNACVNEQGNIAFKIEIKDEINKIFTLRSYLFENYYQSEKTLSINNECMSILNLSGEMLYKHGCETDDHYVEKLIRKRTPLFNLKLDGDIINKYVPPSGHIDEVPFV